MEKLLFALEEKELEMVSGGSVKESFEKYGKGFVELNKGIFVGDGEEEKEKGFFAKRKDGVKKAWGDMGTNGVRAAVVTTEVAIPLAGVAVVGTAIAGGVYGVKKLLNR